MSEQSAAGAAPSRGDRDTGGVHPTMTGLRDHYVRRVNEAVADDRDDLVRELNELYLDEALRLILTTA